MSTTLFIGLEHLFETLQLDTDEQTKVVHASDLATGMKQFPKVSPANVVLPASIDNVCRGGFVGMMNRRFPASRATVIVFNPKKQGSELTIHEWDPSNGSFHSQSASMKALKQRLTVARSWDENATPVMDELPRAMRDALKEIGFYNCVEQDGRSFHVQTEVICTDFVQIKSTVLEGGAVLDATILPYPQHVDDRLEGESIIQAQHKKMIEQVNQGKYS